MADGIKLDHAKLIAMREKAGLKQGEFWNAVGVTQSGGSRYESGRNIPLPVIAEVIRVHVKGEPSVASILKAGKKSLGIEL